MLVREGSMKEMAGSTGLDLEGCTGEVYAQASSSPASKALEEPVSQD